MRPAIALLVLLLAAVAASASGQAGPKAPGETAGDFTTLAKSLGQGLGEIVVNDSILGVETILDRANQSVDAVKRVNYQNGTLLGPYPMNWVMRTITWSLPRDGGVVYMVFNSTITSPDGVQHTNASTFYDPPCPLRQWPLEVGKEWTRACATYTTRHPMQFPTWRNETLKVTGEDVVRTPRGDLPTYLIDHFGENRTTPNLREWYAPDACGPVKMQEFNGQGQPAAVWDLRGFACKTPVALDADVDVDVGGDDITPGGDDPADDAGDAPADDAGDDAQQPPADDGGDAPAQDDAPADDPWTGAVRVDAEDPPATGDDGATTPDSGEAPAQGDASADGEPLLKLGDTPTTTPTGETGSAPTPGPGLALVAAAVGVALLARRRG